MKRWWPFAEPKFCHFCPMNTTRGPRLLLFQAISWKRETWEPKLRWLHHGASCAAKWGAEHGDGELSSMFSRHVLEPGSPDLHGLCETLGCLSPVWFSFSSLVDCLLNVALEKTESGPAKICWWQLCWSFKPCWSFPLPAFTHEKPRKHKWAHTVPTNLIGHIQLWWIYMRSI